MRWFLRRLNGNPLGRPMVLSQFPQPSEPPESLQRWCFHVSNLPHGSSFVRDLQCYIPSLQQGSGVSRDGPDVVAGVSVMSVLFQSLYKICAINLRHDTFLSLSTHKPQIRKLGAWCKIHFSGTWAFWFLAPCLDCWIWGPKRAVLGCCSFHDGFSFFRVR